MMQYCSIWVYIFHMKLFFHEIIDQLNNQIEAIGPTLLPMYCID